MVHHLPGKTLLESRGGDPAAALPHLERAMQPEPEYALAADDLAAVYERQGRLDEPRELYLRAARLAPDLVMARRNAARLARWLEGG